MNILVTGGAGFIGSNFIRQCLIGEQNECLNIVNLDKLTYAGNLANLEDIDFAENYTFVEGDMGDEALVAKLLKEHKISAIIHFAAESHVDRSIDSPEPFFETNVMGTLRLINASRVYWNTLAESEKTAFRFLHVSTDEVYGSLTSEEPAFKETTPYAPNSPYSASKAASDYIVRAYFHTYGFPVLTTNCSNNYGPYQFPEKLIPLMILNALDGKALPIYGDGMNVRDWLYVTDHCRAIKEVLHRGRLGETYNIGGGNELPNIQMVDALCGILDRLRPRADGKSYIEQKTFVKDRPGHDRRYAIDFSKLTSELGWEPEESWETGLEKTVQWYLEHRSWCEQVTHTYSRGRLGTSV